MLLSSGKVPTNNFTLVLPGSLFEYKEMSSRKKEAGIQEGLSRWEVKGLENPVTVSEVISKMPGY